MARPTEKKQVDRVGACVGACAHRQKKTGGPPLLTGGRESIDQKKKHKNHFYIPLVLALHQKDEEEPRRVNNKHDEAYRVLPREVVRRP